VPAILPRVGKKALTRIQKSTNLFVIRPQQQLSINLTVKPSSGKI